MSSCLSAPLSASIEDIIKQAIRKKLKNYSPESKYMPFHHRLLGKDRMALFSFIHSLNTTFGVSIFEPVAKALANSRFNQVATQVKIGNNIISQEAQAEVQDIINEISVSGLPDKKQEVERIRCKCQTGKASEVGMVQADLMFEDDNGEVHLFDIKTAKPNQSSFKDYKRTLLEWSAAYLYENPKAKINTYIAIPYNPYEPEPYQRWTLKGMLDVDNELMVGEELWDFWGGKGAYDEVLACFERAGIELRPEIDACFKKFK